jgi:hypothetical protein
MIWTLSGRFDPAAVAIADRHYNRQKVGSNQFVPPASCLVLISDGALWATTWPKYVQHAWPGAWMNTLFRKERGELQASAMIRQAVAATRWWFGEAPEIGMVSFVDPTKVRRKRDPGRCYLRAGFKMVGKTQSGLLAFQLLPPDMPAPEPPLGATLDLLDA